MSPTPISSPGGLLACSAWPKKDASIDHCTFLFLHPPPPTPQKCPETLTGCSAAHHSIHCLKRYRPIPSPSKVVLWTVDLWHLARLLFKPWHPRPQSPFLLSGSSHFVLPLCSSPSQLAVATALFGKAFPLPPPSRGRDVCWKLFFLSLKKKDSQGF